jgi:hypothetical protein
VAQNSFQKNPASEAPTNSRAKSVGLRTLGPLTIFGKRREAEISESKVRGQRHFELTL